MSLQKLAYNGDSKIILNLVNQVNQLIDGGGAGGVSDVQVDGTSVVTAGVANILLQSVSNLANYYLKSETYTQAEVDALIGAISTISIEVVQALPTTNIKTNVIYLVPKSPSQTNNYYDEYINTTGTSAGWELIGDTEIDLSNYVTFTDLNTALADYVTSSGLTTILADYVLSSSLATVATSGSYNDLSDKPTIPVGSDYVQKSGDTMTGSLEINSASANVLRVVRTNSGTTVQPTQLVIGNNIADGNVGATYGNLILYGDGTRYGQLQARNLTASRTFQLPNKSGTVALTDDIQTYISDFKTPTDAVITDGVAEFDTLEENYVKDLSVDIKPVQDLHGYDHPWVGGAGKNLFNPSTATVGNKYSVSGDVFTVLSATGNVAISQYTFLANTTYTINITMKSGTVKPCIIIRNPDSSTEGQKTNYADTSQPLTFNFTQDTTWNILLQATGSGSVISVGDTFVIQLEQGNQATPYEPYSNICPISGHTEVDLYNVGKNRLPAYNLATIKARNTSGTWNGNTYTLSGITFGFEFTSDGLLESVVCNGTATADISLRISPNIVTNIWNGMVVSGAPNIGTSSIQIYDATTNQNIYAYYSSNATITFANGDDIRWFCYIPNGATYNNAIFKPMVRLATETDDTFEPYNGYSVTIPFGQTVYGGTLDVISGVLTVDRFYFSLSGTENFALAQASSANPRRFNLNITSAFSAPNIKSGSGNMELSSHFKYATNALTNPWGVFRIALSGSTMYLVLPDANSVYASDTDVENYFATQYANGTPAQFSYVMATPQTYQLTPQQLKALLGENNISASTGEVLTCKYTVLMNGDDLDIATMGKVSISALGTDESGNATASRAYSKGEYFYKDGYICTALADIALGATLTLNTNYSESTLDDVLESKISRDEFYNNAGSHNSIYRGKYLGSSVTASQWTAIQNGTFEDLFIGDYWTINNKNWRIAHFDYWIGTGDTECTDHHVVIVPDTRFYTASMNSTNTTAGGYYNSEMRGGANYLVQGSSGLYDTKVAIDNAFGSSHILSHRVMLTNSVSSGVATGWEWCDSSVDIMSEVMVYGSLAFSSGGKGFEVGVEKEQLALFRHDHSRITNRTSWWLRGVYSASGFSYASTYGVANRANASDTMGVRPCFAIK